MEHQSHQAGHGLPGNEQGQQRANATGPHETTLNLDSERPNLTAQDRKRQADMQARAALAGIALHRLADGSWLASRWNLCKPLTDSEVGAWLDRVCGVAS